MKTFVIVNPASSGGATAQAWPDICSKIEKAIGNHKWGYTEARGHASELSRRALRDGYERIVAVGGDGTIHEVINGFFDNDEQVFPQAVLGIIDAGTGGDFRKNINLPKDIETQIACIRQGKTKEVSLGKASYFNDEGHPATSYFSVICSFGISAVVNSFVNDRPRLKKYASDAAFTIGGLKGLLGQSKVNVKVTIDSQEFYTGPLLLGSACNGPKTGGGMLLAPDACCFTPELDFVFGEDLGLIESLKVFPAIYKGRHIGKKKISHKKGYKMRVEALDDQLITVDMDGDVKGVMPLEVSVCPRAINVIVPAS